MKLSALMDFPDDALHVYHESTMYKVMERLKQAGVSRVYMQYYGNRDYGHFWDHKAPRNLKAIETANNIPEFNRVFVDAANAFGLEPVAVMRPQEQGMWLTWSPYHKEARENPGIPYTGGDIMIASKFQLENPELRIKRRTWDIDPDTLTKTICSIKLYKQNDIHSRIKKENIKIFVSPDNSNYIIYKGDFDLSFSYKTAEKDVIVSSFKQNYPTETITCKGDNVEVIILGGLDINEKYVAIEISCDQKASEEELFYNTPMNTISIYDKNDNEICASPGHASRFCPQDIPFLDAGFHFDDGFGENFGITLDPEGDKGYIAISKGKDEYVHAALCVLEPKVQEYWFKWLEKAMDDGFVMIGNRLECHSVHVDEPYAYGYNDCIKEEYYKRYGECAEKDMELSKIAKIRGDAYTALFVEGAKRVRARGKKVYLTLNVEMLYNPIPLVRHMAYPMNVQWQWERWLEEIQPDEINIRSYQTSPDFILNDPQCKNFIETAQKYNVPLTLERYDYWDFAAEFEMVRDTGLFSRMTLYEINDIIHSDGKGGIIEIKPELLKQLESLTNIREV